MTSHHGYPEILNDSPEREIDCIRISRLAMKKDSKKYKTIKQQVKQGMRRLYRKYVESITRMQHHQKRGCFNSAFS